MKKYAFILGIMGLFILISLLFVVALNSADIISFKTLSIFKIIIILSSMFIGGFLIGKKSSKKGWLEGLKIGLIFIFLLFIFNIILGNGFSFKNMFYDLILCGSCVFGSMLGINKKE